MNRSASMLLRTCLAIVFVAGVSGAALGKESADPCGTKAEPKLKKPGTGNDLYVKDGVCTVDAGTYKYGAITIFPGAELKLADANIDFTVESIVIQKGGSMTAGSESAPIGSINPTNSVVIRFVGDRPAKAVVSHHDDCSAVDKGIGVMDGGTLRLFGAKGIPSRGGISWTHLSSPAGPKPYDTAGNAEVVVKNGLGGRRIELARNVKEGSNPWQVGDWIVIATTSYSPFESEFAQIDTIDGTAITLKTPLKHYHFGGADPGPAVDPSAPFGAGIASASFTAGKDKNYGVDERAEVGLISRNIVLTAATPDAVTNPTNPSRNWGGETKFCAGFKEVSLEGVEIEKFGKEILGSYPIHFHMAGDVAGRQRINANSVHHSFNKCMTIHSTANAVFENNVCARITGHIFYQEIGDEPATKFIGNLALGAMNNSFGLPPGATPGSTKGFWEGDNKAAQLGYTGLDIANTDNPNNPVHGSCYRVDRNNGLLYGRVPPPCETTGADPQYYVEPPTGFWIINPSAVLEGNSVAGCQGQGRGYWYVPPKTGDLKFQPVGRFRNNRVHGCYDGIFGEPEEAVESEQLFPKVGGVGAGANLIARFEGFTASRIRNRGVWMRPTWNVFENARIATSREGVALVTSGGLDGNAPGVWGLLKHSVVVAISTNNVDRWGPCADTAKNDVKEFYGCVDYNSNAKDALIKGYPGPGWNFAGFYIYDGPVRIHDTRFVRYRVDPKPLLTTDDAAILARIMPSDRPYEGDAALGWFAANPSAYPTATEVKGLVFEETNLRHQIFTEKVNLSDFKDGDKNTAVIDRDGSLTGFRVLDKDGNPAAGHHPISLNNLPFNAVSNAVDECLAEGAQDKIQEGRPTSLISPANMASLEFEALQLDDGTSTDANGQVSNQSITFTRDSGDHASMTLTGRNAQGIWEPKVASGLGYTVRASAGIPKFINVGLTDAVKPNMNADPFYVRVGVCYTTRDGAPPPDPQFHIARGYKSWGGNGAEYDNPVMRRYFNKLNKLYDNQVCENLNAQTRGIQTMADGCPADGVVIKHGACPAGSVDATDMRGQPACIFKATALLPGTFEELAPGGKPDPSKFHYDPTTGMLFFYVIQNEANTLAPSPIGSCIDANDTACPKPDETFYGCPAQGCPTYTVKVTGAYAPGPSSCGGPTETAIYTKEPKYVLQEPKDANKLGYVAPFPAGVNATTPVDPQSLKTPQGFPHRVALAPPICTGTP